MMRAFVIVGLLAAAACTPDYYNGDLQCSAAEPRCPDGFHCALDNTCWQDGADPDLASPPDLAGDLLQPDDQGGLDDGAVGGGADGIVTVCGWSLLPTNFDPCALPTSAGDWIIATDGNYDTSTHSGAGGPAGITVMQGGVLTRLVRVGQFTVQQSTTLTLTGALPLIVVVDNATIAGQILVQSGTDPAQCTPPGTPTVGASCGAGGGGGGFGAPGGVGGGCNSGGTSSSGPGSGDATLSPLRGGCSGKPGATTGTIASVMSAWGGGAVQISARLSLSVTGIINANGRVGAPGGGTTSGCGVGGAVGCSSGGGGGGSGGGILLESVSMVVGSTAKLCANGGAGGGGGAPNGAGGGAASMPVCDAPASQGGAGASGGGGNGGSGGVTSGTVASGGNGVSGASGASGGGAGGGVGRIRVRAGNLMPVSGGAVISPPAAS